MLNFTWYIYRKGNLIYKEGMFTDKGLRGQLPLDITQMPLSHGLQSISHKSQYQCTTVY